MRVSKIIERRKYAQSAMDCLSRMAEAATEAEREREREKALEWIRRANVILIPLKA